MMHALAVLLAAVSGSDHVLVPTLSAAVGPVAPSPSDADPCPGSAGVEDYCRIRRDSLTELRGSLAASLPEPADPAAAPRPPLLSPIPPRAELSPPTEHAPSLALRTRSPGR